MPYICVSKRNVSGELMVGYIVLAELITASKCFPTQFIRAADQCPEKESGNMPQLGVGWQSWAQCRPPSPIYPSNRLLQNTYLLHNWTLTLAGSSISQIPSTQQEEKSTGKRREERRTTNNPQWCFTGCFIHIFIQETIINMSVQGPEFKMNQS